MSGPLISVQGLAVGFGGQPLLEGIGFEVEQGQVLVIIGESGCGKTLLLKNMIGLYRPLAGRVLIAGTDLAASEGDQRRAVQRKFGVAYQSGALFGSMSLLDNVRLPLEEYTRLDDAAIELVARLKLSQVGLLGSEAKMPAELSGGMQKRAAIARAMALDPAILFLDEPSAGLDPVTAAGIDQLILQLSDAQGITFVVVTHELASIFAIADRAVMLDREARGIIAAGKPEDLRDHSPHPRVARFFHREAAP
ncbi:MAG: transporter related [Rhodocyclaceae bacterium]|nr:transporter related [Rhodocyclaceae bacterium]